MHAGAEATDRAPVVRDAALDLLRVVGVACVLVAHVGEVFNPWDDWHVTAPVRSRVIGILVVLVAPWVLPLLMLVAGATAWHVLARRGPRGYLHERVVRVLLPLVGGTLLLGPLQMYLERRWRGEYAGSFVAFVPRFFDGVYPAGNFTLHHLWFLAHVMVYALVALPLFRYWQTPAGRAPLERVARWCAGPAGLLLLAAPLLAERLAFGWALRARWPLATDWTNQALLFGAYVYGYAIADVPALARDVDRQWRFAVPVAAAFALGLVTLVWRGVLPAALPSPFTADYVTFWALYGLGSWAWLVVLLGAARQVQGALGGRRPRWLAWATHRSFAWYVVHQPLVIAFAVLLADRGLPLAVSFAAILALTLLTTLAAGELMLHVPGLRVAFGRATLGVTRSAARPRPDA